MINVQVAFQGGGAKLVNMLAVAEELERAHNAGEITITRVAGTSAGSIVACLLASNIGIVSVRQSLQTEEMRRIATSLSQIRTIRAIGYVLLGRPILSIEPLLTWMNRLLQRTSPQPVRRTIAEISAMRPERPMELLIVSSDLENRGSRKAGPDDDAVSAIADSCAIPFLFRTWRGSGYRFVDGGVCSNLPVDFLLDKVREWGEVLAVSFEGQPTQPHNGLLSFLLALVDTAISSGEAKARNSLPPENVCLISTDLTTIAFDRAVTHGLSEQYVRIRQDAEKWLRNYLNIRKNKALSLKIDPWRDESPSSVRVMRDVGKYFEALEAHRFILYHKATLLVVANSLRSPADIVSGATDAMEFTLEFSTCDKAVHMMSMSVAELHSESTLDASTLVCSVTDSNGKVLPATLIPMRKPSTPEDRDVCVCYSTPLPENSGPYLLRYGLQGTNFMRELQLTGYDEINYYPVRARQPLGTLELILQVPIDYPVEVGQKGVGRSPRQLQDHEMRSGRPYGLKSYGFTAEEIEQGDNLWRMTVKSLRHQARARSGSGDVLEIETLRA